MSESIGFGKPFSRNMIIYNSGMKGDMQQLIDKYKLVPHPEAVTDFMQKHLEYTKFV